MNTLINTELKKLKKSGFIYFIIAFNIISIFIGSAIFSANKAVFVGDGDQSIVLWGQSSLYSSQLFFPILVGILCAVSWQIEEKNKNWQKLLTSPLTPLQIVSSKFITIIIFTLINQLLFYVMFIFSSMILNIPKINFTLFILWSILGWVGSFSIVAVQLFLSIRIRSFASPILISAGGALLGLISLFLGEFISFVFPYSQLQIGMRARALQNFNVTELLIFILISIIYSIIFILLATNSLDRREN
uniref:LmgG-immunity to the lacticin LMG n=1 Tax=Lactococcus lactis subsp. lactis TaxID=1360 RepID=A0A0M7BGA9_LACLL|nr:LmgG-immunity to the lacticin LMG [Lactococcus lactis subsp. lactis]